MKSASLIDIAALILVAAIATGCSKKEEKKPASQVAAKVNADEITVSQVNNVLARAQNLAPEATIKAKADILEKLIDQQLAKQQAIASKLDRTPAVVQAVEAAHNEILARAYLQKVVTALPKPTVDEVKKYYATHPELFSQRRVYNLEELTIEPKQGVASALKEQIATGKSLPEIAGWLKSQNVNFSANRGVRAAEALPLELLPQLQVLKDGDMQVVESGGRLNLFHVVASQAVPVDETAATPRIQQFLFNQNVTKVVASEMKALRDKSDITYAGEFVGGAAAADVKAKAEAEASAKRLANEQAEAKAKEQTKAEADAARRASAATKPTPAEAQLRQENIEKALGGLK